MIRYVFDAPAGCALAGIVGAKTGKPWHRITKESAREYEKRHPRHSWGPC